ncbi:unnamed protein product [Darwinula stevensoni]|uniref:Uncharacterized protein n=1 Tax=Darwinula stevensoni TaxID=69355 RepID=A0A7R9FN72_9CRUS|nr:unnamed protein product [Darwinula stevensoni]CAG0896494.1 unnamed protein product [Darwinula stevensoni]
MNRNRVLKKISLPDRARPLYENRQHVFPAVRKCEPPINASIQKPVNEYSTTPAMEYRNSTHSAAAAGLSPMTTMLAENVKICLTNTAQTRQLKENVYYANPAISRSTQHCQPQDATQEELFDYSHGIHGVTREELYDYCHGIQKLH